MLAGMKFLQVLPLSVVMVAGPQILSSVFFATSEKWKSLSLSYIVGAALSIPIVVTLAYLLGSGATDEGSDNETIYWIILALLVYAMIRTFLKRGESEPPKWMGKLQDASPRFAFTLGFLLLGVFPSDLITSISVGSFLAAGNESLAHCIPFVFLTLLFLALPFLGVLLMGERAELTLPKVRDWMNANAWIVNEVVLVFFIVMVGSNLT